MQSWLKTGTKCGSRGEYFGQQHVETEVVDVWFTEQHLLAPICSRSASEIAPGPVPDSQHQLVPIKWHNNPVNMTRKLGSNRTGEGRGGVAYRQCGMQ